MAAAAVLPLSPVDFTSLRRSCDMPVQPASAAAHISVSTILLLIRDSFVSFKRLDHRACLQGYAFAHGEGSAMQRHKPAVSFGGLVWARAQGRSIRRVLIHASDTV